MIVGSVTESGKSMPLPDQAKLPVSQDTAQRDDDTKKAVQAPSLTELSELASDAQKNMKIIHNVNLQFSVNKESGRIMVTVTDEATGKVIREIPPEEIVRFAEKFDEMVGMIFDKKG
jgi:flagellar protein FlaG